MATGTLYPKNDILDATKLQTQLCFCCKYDHVVYNKECVNVSKGKTFNPPGFELNPHLFSKSGPFLALEISSKSIVQKMKEVRAFPLAW